MAERFGPGVGQPFRCRPDRFLGDIERQEILFGRLGAGLPLVWLVNSRCQSAPVGPTNAPS
ncbi:MAG TPA: hypothetical protein VG412_08850 [Acidimicrobiales bacterium]|nr:hypothetical protein [Acidimicrobiales bacterium]